MGEFNELIRNFDKIRDYMRDFYIYGFKSRNDFNRKSARTYDNEKRRIESYMGEYMKWSYTKSGKNSFISMDCSKIPVNPLYSAWKSKAFTSNDIMLHFYLLDILNSHAKIAISQLTDEICEKSHQTFDIQTVRNKCSEYVSLGLLKSDKQGKSLYYSLSKESFDGLLAIAPGLAAAVSFYQGSTALGEIGNYIMDNHTIENTLFNFKHYYVAHTLEDNVLLDILSSIRNKQSIEFENYNEAGNLSSTSYGIPLRVFVSSATGRRYLCIYQPRIRRFFTYRLDHIKSVKAIGFCEDTDKYLKILDKNIDKVWGVGFGGRSRMEIVCMKLYINEQKEHYLLERIAREGHGGEVLRLSANVFLYTKEVFDTNDMSPWIKTFIGRIIQLEGSNQAVIGRFYNDINRMKEMYDIG
ncbi:WYL domain-containing protein [Anaerocolumna cellulosilytica]|uniref:WYL domain-containing protein n=1 Tax=Anaerocolumna cellulosilytica TaxID=433286 RepID=A0A6S6R823_9FIRM|nr:WYL domain-containing protein [Anaerocolumna cellulosilytica]MBB5197473.1 hypothetical protein [Anaerocolumna cellulosilytica]BCJ95492.1 WYL domain-containing protein [Anaerocolumna cellulosilytica]